MKFFKNNAGSYSVGMSPGSSYSLSADNYGKNILTAPLTSHNPAAGSRPSGLFRSYLISSSNQVLTALPTLYLYKGSLPSREEIDQLLISSVIKDTLRPSDFLFECPGNPATTSISVASSNYSCSFASDKQAVATGKATWFLMHFTPAHATAQVTDPFFFVGSVGLIGSGADLELSEVDLQEGVNYQPPAYSLRVLPIGFDFEE